MATSNPDFETPADLGYAMPAEWARHEATWLGWPRNPTDWPDKLDTIRWVYGEMVRKIGAGEKIRLLVANQAEEIQARHYLSRAGANLRHVEFLAHPTNRGWMRDSGPIFVRETRRGRTRKPRTAIVHFHFNACGSRLHSAGNTERHPSRPKPQKARRKIGKTACSLKFKVVVLSKPGFLP